VKIPKKICCKLKFISTKRPTPELIYSNRKDENPLPISRGGLNTAFSRRQKKKLSMISESFEEEEEPPLLDSQDNLILSEEELAALPAEERRRYSMRASIRSSIGANIDEFNLSEERRKDSILASIRSSIGANIYESNLLTNLSGQQGIIRKSIRRSIIKKNVNTISEVPEEYENYYEDDKNAANGRRESIARSRKQSLDNYASLRASRDQFLSEEYIRGIPEDSEPEELPLNTARRKS
jgi:hypothetical protein